MAIRSLFNRAKAFGSSIRSKMQKFKPYVPMINRAFNKAITLGDRYHGAGRQKVDISNPRTYGNLKGFVPASKQEISNRIKDRVSEKLYGR